MWVENLISEKVWMAKKGYAPITKNLRTDTREISISNKICFKHDNSSFDNLPDKSSNFEHMPSLVKQNSSFGYELNSIFKLFRTKCFLIKENSSFDGFSANRTFGHSISAHLTGSMPTQENHVLQTIQTHWAHCLEKK